MKKIILILVVIPGVMGARAQFVTDYLKAADSYYKKGDYYSAAQYYEKYLASKTTKAKPEDYNPYNVKPASGVKSAVPGVQLAVYNLAESYRQLNYPVKAVAYYEQALRYKNSELPLALYYYAVTLRALGNYEGAERTFQQFLDEYKTEDVYANSAKSEVLNLHFIREQLNRDDLKLYSEEKQGQQINAGGANYSPVWVNSSTLLFTSTRAEGDLKDKPFLNRLYEAVYENGEVKSVNQIEIPQGAGIHQGVAAVSPDGKTMFLTRWSLVAGKKTSAIYTSKKLDSGWAEPVLFDALVNTPGYNAQQPFIMADGKTLLFSSDKPGGSGGFDLWYTTLDADGKPGKAVNLGATINTVNDEQAPYYHDASGTLVFSCNGRTGMGGFDFFFSKGTPEAWATPENFGYPVNSIKDDIYFTSRGSAKNILEDVLLSSDRSAECCLELFNLKRKDSIPNPVPVPVTEVVKEEPKVESVIVLENVYYDFDSSTLRVDSYPALDKLVGLLNEYPTMVIEIRAHTDNKGNDKYNLNLSGARAKVVVDYLISKGINKDRLQSKGYGAGMPVVPNTHEDGSDDPDGRQKNRRTEFKVLAK
ncbi:OmpA family protein [Niastella populi]|uniref:Flagellar motor protein MotB n=1 Tax=Niastella populi TaxID=550983 RepID=A0A1V9FE59_9BACT|nr:OmpA family protein [Niastella populi]OQP56654.1 flagellar motor protein MotB [Niastella populi]